MTTHTLAHTHVDARRPAVTGEQIAAAVTAIAFILLLPAASILHAALAV